MFAKSLLASAAVTILLAACGQAPQSASASQAASFGPSSVSISGPGADSFLDALTGAGAYDASGALGAQNIALESVHCSAAVVPHPVPHCTLVENGQTMQADQSDAAVLFRTLVDNGAVIHNGTVGATNTVATNVQCSRVVYPGAHATCSFLAGQ